MREHVETELQRARIVLKERPDRSVTSEHISVLIDENVRKTVFATLLFCPEARLQGYKDKSFVNFIASKDLTTPDQATLTDFIGEVVDPKIVSIRHSLNLVRKLEENSFDTAIDEQGSGVRSLLCLVADILSEKQARILLIDEPELGLNSLAKHAFLKFLIEQSKEKQVFLTTHDPTFVNPILWDEDHTSVFLFSLVNNDS